MNRQLQTLPVVTIEIDGSALSSADMSNIAEIRVQQALSLPAVCEITFFSPTDSFNSSGFSAPGKSLRVSVDGSSDPLFNGQITAVQQVYGADGARQVRLRGYDKLHLLRKRQPVRALVQMTLSDLLNELTGDLGFSVKLAEDSSLLPRIIQFEQTDFDLLTRYVQANGLYFNLRGDTLHVFTLEGSGDAVELKLGVNLLEAQAEMNAEHACRNVTTTGWDATRAEAFSAAAGSMRSGRSVSAELDAGAFTGSLERFLVDRALFDEGQAQAISQSELDWRAAREISFWGVAEGDTKLIPGVPVSVEGLATDLSGSYIVSSVIHTIDTAKGFVSEISTLPPTPISHLHRSLATLGIVTKVDDPDKFGRVCVKLPNYNNAETDWLQVLTAGAGIGKGLLAIPDVDDSVLIFFPNGELTQGIVMGGLFGAMQREGFDWGVDEARVKRFSLLTGGGQKMIFDDTNKKLRVENSDGSFIEMSPEKVHLHAQRDLEIEAPGRAITIKGKTIDFEQA
jgi:uncharacterized protein involved in type VI secretion and phage assembly